MFDRDAFDLACMDVANHYEKSAPQIETWCDWMCAASGDKITLSDIGLLMFFSSQKPQPNHAVNNLYKHQSHLGRDTTGMADY